MSSCRTETEVKVQITGRKAFADRVAASGFRLQTPRTFEDNLLFDRPDRELRGSGRLLRLRRYGNHWTLTYKSKAKDSVYKVREEIETKVEDGPQMQAILLGLGYQVVFRYQKYRTEWADGSGHVVLDETPIGDYAELEGPPEWIDNAAKSLTITQDQYITKSYAEIYSDWRRQAKDAPPDMVFSGE